VGIDINPERIQEAEEHAKQAGTRIVSTFDIGEWKPDKELALDDNSDDYDSGISHKLFFWILRQRNENVKPR
jgi:hypothetical protein